MKKVRITKMPEMKHGGNTRMFGAQTPPIDKTVSPGPGSFHGGNDPKIKINRTLKPTTKENATLEAEVGETIVTNLSGDGIPEFYKIGGKRHYKGGTPLNVPENSFIFSRDKSMKIDDPEILKMFGKSGGSKKSYTPAELSASYDLNKYKEILADPSSSRRDIETAEQMIKNYNLKLGALALVQESIKGFDNGIPNISMPYLQSVGIDPAQLVNPQMAPTPEQMQTAMYGKEFKSKSSSMPAFKTGGELTKYQTEGNVKKEDSGDNKKEEGIKAAVEKEKKKGQKIKVIIQKNGKPIYFDERRNVISGTLPEDAIFVDKDGKSVDRNGKPLPKKIVYDEIDKVYFDPETGNTVKPEIGDEVEFIKEDGTINPKKQKITEINIKGFEGNVSDYVTDEEKGILGDYTEPYARLAYRLKNDETLREALITEFKNNVAQLKPSDRVSQAQIDALSKLEGDQIIDEILNAEKQFMEIRAAGLNYDKNKPGDFDKWQRNISGDDQHRHPQGYHDAVAKLNQEPLTNTQALIFQVGAGSLNNLNKNQDPAVAGLNLSALGSYNDLSKFDATIGSNTSGTLFMDADPEYNYTYADLDPEQITEDKTESQLTDTTPMPEGDLPWHTQDLVNLRGAQEDLFGINKYRPFRPGIQFDTPEFAGVDFRGAAGTLASGMAGAANQLGQMAGPQAFNARMADIQAKGAEGVAKLREQEYRTNQAMLNQFNTNVAQMRNQNALTQAATDKKYFDETAIANQQFDNARRMAKANIRTAFNQGLTNVEKTDFYNQMYDDFKVVPGGGYGPSRVFKTDNPAKIKPGTSDKTFDAWAAETRRVVPNATDDQLLKSWENYQDKFNSSSKKKNQNYPQMYPNYNFAVNPMNAYDGIQGRQRYPYNYPYNNSYYE